MGENIIEIRKLIWDVPTHYSSYWLDRALLWKRTQTPFFCFFVAGKNIILHTMSTATESRWFERQSYREPGNCDVYHTQEAGIVLTLGSVLIRTALTSFYNNINTKIKTFNKIVGICNTYILLSLRDILVISSKTLYICCYE